MPPAYAHVTVLRATLPKAVVTPRSIEVCVFYGWQRIFRALLQIHVQSCVLNAERGSRADTVIAHPDFLRKLSNLAPLRIISQPVSST